ncbi:hypothetical protein ACJIZ3_010899 [Penstemon smallii]|uniref:Triacylglycerol lipase n=1 Tax=Penstemon smallii TaxID=265156 RepID=A0ABD3UHQ7_9LAMI
MAMIREGTIKMYDYGDDKENEKHYGQPSPPSYEMKNIPSNIPLYLAYGGADALSDKEDVKLLIQSLQDHELDKIVLEYTEDYAHADYVMAVNVKENVTTKDGYILSMQRIPMGRAGGGERNEAKTPVDASTWVSNSPHESLGFILADNGFDVWLANVRGTNYSRGHISLSPADAAYWNWSWDELVAYDLPASLQYVHDQTGQKLHYVGHSLGTLMAFGAFSRQEVLNIVRSAALLSPIAYLGQIPSPLARAAADAFIAEVLEKLILDSQVGNIYLNLSRICFTIIGPNCCLNSSKSYIDHEEPTATKNMVHLAQSKCLFQRRDPQHFCTFGHNFSKCYVFWSYRSPLFI